MIELPEIVEPQTAFVANMRALWEHNPAFAQQIELVDEQDFLSSQPSRNGLPTCQVIGPMHRPIYLHSRYDPQREAARWADGVAAQAQAQEDAESGRTPMCYFVDGFGLGYHVKELFDRLLGEAFIVVSESNIALIRTALNLLDYSEMFTSNRVIIITRTDRDEIFKKLQSRNQSLMMGVVFTHPLQNINPEFHREIHTVINEYVSYIQANMATMLKNSVLTCKHILYNMPTYVATPSIGILQSRFAGDPAVIVSAGPSLGRNIALLKEIRDRVVVIAVQTTLKVLLAAGIEPDFVTSLDYHEVSRKFFEGLEELENTHLVAEPKAHWDIVDYYRGRGPISLIGNHFARAVLKSDEPDNHDNLTAGSTVAHLAFYLGRYIGADPIIFVGQDLAFTDNVYYSPGNALHRTWKPEINRFCTIEMKEWERIVRSRGILRKIKDHHGQEIYTDVQMFTYLQQFEKDFAQSSARIIDATEGGALKQFTEPMTLAQAAQKYCREPIDSSKFEYRKKIKWFDSNKLKPGLKCIKERIEDVHEFHDIVGETIDILKEMIELVDDQPALNRKMVRLDELRIMVRQRLNTYDLIAQVVQSAELLRYRMDRTIDLQGIEGKDRQRRQLKRDISYVSELDKGCQHALEILQESIERFEETIAEKSTCGLTG